MAALKKEFQSGYGKQANEGAIQRRQLKQRKLP
jgi:hypothetical protein